VTYGMGRKVAWKEKVVTLAQVLTESCEKYGQKAAVVLERKGMRSRRSRKRLGNSRHDCIGWASRSASAFTWFGPSRSIEKSMRKV